MTPPPALAPVPQTQHAHQQQYQQQYANYAANYHPTAAAAYAHHQQYLQQQHQQYMPQADLGRAFATHVLRNKSATNAISTISNITAQRLHSSDGLGRERDATIGLRPYAPPLILPLDTSTSSGKAVDGVHWIANHFGSLIYLNLAVVECPRVCYQIWQPFLLNVRCPGGLVFFVECCRRGISLGDSLQRLLFLVKYPLAEKDTYIYIVRRTSNLFALREPPNRMGL
ncbi:hypothetical protein NECAME_10386 [Necator americanus]|uniref:Uncharacterized protein n=1 Tax=Necator americanus TaxID=51031 RepID=W2TBI8_NECAM|nr:hypothetical protein NECAME_10386 [Necator americanus]ETN78357.1 hypothetical protein NECAME_10386 [Necator americanus]